MDNILKDPKEYLPLTSIILEVFGLLLIAINYKSVCIQGNEIAVQAYVFLLFIYTFMISDILYFGLLFFSDKNISMTSFSVMYHIVAFIFCIIGSIILGSSLTFCGNKAQIMIAFAVGFGLLAAIVHLSHAIIIRENLPDGRRLAKRRT